jgi:ATP-dependent Clp protease ATP-binding subunit ClpA
VTEAAKDYLADEGYDPHFGARPLRRVIQSKIEDVLSEGILAGDFQLGDTVLVDYQDDQIAIEVTARAEPEVELVEPEAVA